MKKLKPVGENPKKQRRNVATGAVKGPVKGYHVKQGK
jgi:hypothetical protein